MRRRVLIGFIVAIALAAGLQAQGPAPAQIQAALRALGLAGIGYSNGECAAWSTASGKFIPGACSGGSAAPSDATYVTRTANSDLSAEFSLGTLTTGILLNTVSSSTGVLTAYAGSSCSASNYATAISGSGVLTCATVSGSGDVVGPGSATDNAVPRFDTTTGKLLQNSLFIVDDSGNLSTAGTTLYLASGGGTSHVNANGGGGTLQFDAAFIDIRSDTTVVQFGGGLDAGLSYNASGVLEVNTGTQGAFGFLRGKFKSSDNSSGCTGTATAVKDGIATSCAEPEDWLGLLHQLASDVAALKTQRASLGR